MEVPTTILPTLAFVSVELEAIWPVINAVLYRLVHVDSTQEIKVFNMLS